MDRRRFLASAAATAIAPSCLAQPATDFAAAKWGTSFLITPPPPGIMVFMPNRIYALGCGEPRLVRWSDQEDHNDWSLA